MMCPNMNGKIEIQELSEWNQKIKRFDENHKASKMAIRNKF